MGICTSSSSDRRRKPHHHCFHRCESRRLLTYPRGSKHVKCSCCQTVNLVLEADEVGQVNCNNCKLLLMYPYGAPSVRCSSCNSVTDIRENNKRPPWSVQQGPLKTFNNVR
ncbi:unnamed protein product [Arabis nemorensis]|uniref:Zinc finger LSD1-type domain-containing protein n=1 Tax=Arabis nemorensis TaxID=586526 RepID=A0A565CEU9_9BRAS|nr:unnamed protein product [Arabis nemorensis]